MMAIFKVVVAGKRYSLSGDFQEVLSAIKDCPGRSWNPALKTWSIYDSQSLQVATLLGTYSLHKEQKSIHSFSNDDIITDFSYEGYDYLFPYQKTGVMYLLSGKVLLCDEVGLGKSVQSLVYAKLLNAKKILIVCPSPLKWQWAREIEKFLGVSKRVVFEGTLKERTSLTYKYNDLLKKDDFPSFCIVNYELLIAMGMNVFLNNKEWDLVIFDEIHRIKNWASQTHKAARRLNSSKMIGLTATPFVNNPLELYTVVSFLKSGNFMKVNFFREKYCIFETKEIRGNEIEICTGYKNLDSLYSELKPIMIRRKKQEVMAQLPKRFHATYEVSLSSVEQSIMEQCVWNMKDAYDHEDRNVCLAWLTMARMVCDSTELLNESKSEFALKCQKNISSKAEMLKEVVNQIEGKVLIFTQWEKMAYIIARELGSDECQVITGSSDDKLGLIDEFKDSDKKYLVVTDCLNYGVNLEFIHHLVHFDIPWTPAKIEQREGRIDRVTQQKDMMIFHLVCKGTIEEMVLSKILKKQQMFEEAVEGTQEDLSLHDIIGEFLKKDKI